MPPLLGGDQTFEYSGTDEAFATDKCFIFGSENSVQANLPTSLDGSGTTFSIDLSPDGAESSRVTVRDAADTIHWEAAAYALGGAVEGWEIDGDTVSGTAMFRDLVTFSEELVSGSFELTCR